MNPNLYDEPALIDAARGGDLEAFNQIVLAHQDGLFRIAVNILRDEDAAEDAVQEAFISAFRNIRSFRGSSLKAWLMRVVVNSCYDQLRRLRRHPSMPLDGLDEYDQEIESPSWLADPSSLPEEQVEARERVQAIQEGLNGLPLPYRLVIVLVDIQGMAYEDAADALRVPLGTVKSRLARARLALRASLTARPDLQPGQAVFSMPPVLMPGLA
jgi:RNA polymerase sigma-70 factor (ECF subfamily)